MVYEPPPGDVDFASDAEQYARRHPDEDLVVIDEHGNRDTELLRDGNGDPVLVEGRTVTVTECAVDDFGEPILHTDTGLPYLRIDCDVDPDTGAVFRDSMGIPYTRWKHTTIEYAPGEDDPDDAPPRDVHPRMLVLQVRVPEPAAIGVVSMTSIGKYATTAKQGEMTTKFVQNHLSRRTWDELMDAIMEPDSGWSMEDYGKIIRRLLTMNTARPTGPSQG